MTNDTQIDKIAAEAAGNICRKRDDIKFSEVEAIIKSVIEKASRATTADAGVKRCECGHTEIQHLRYSDHDECTACEGDEPCDHWRPVAPKSDAAASKAAADSAKDTSPKEPKHVRLNQCKHGVIKQDCYDCKPKLSPPEPRSTEATKCKTHPDAPHGFDRDASISEDRYVCECEYWEPPTEAAGVPSRIKVGDTYYMTVAEHYAILNERTESAVVGEWWYEQTADDDWSIGTGNRGLALVEDEYTAKTISDAHNAALRAQQQDTARLMEAATEAIIALAVFKITDNEKTYTEISPEFREQIIHAHDLLLAAMKSRGAPDAA